jgi:hypothetical protein
MVLELKKDKTCCYALPDCAYVDFIYKCPYCESEIWLSELEAKIQKQITCCCEKVINIHSISNIKLTYDHTGKQDEIVEVAISTLVENGYTRDKAQEYVTGVDNYTAIKDVKLLVKSALQLVK